MRARFYSDATGRFTRPDPLGLGGGDPNLYRYVGNAPVQFIDPPGLGPGELITSFFGGIVMDVGGSVANGQDPDIGGAVVSNGVTLPGMPSGGAAAQFALDPENAVNIVRGLKGLDRQGSGVMLNEGAERQRRMLDAMDGGGDDGAGGGDAGGDAPAVSTPGGNSAPRASAPRAGSVPAR